MGNDVVDLGKVRNPVDVDVVVVELYADLVGCNFHPVRMDRIVAAEQSGAVDLRTEQRGKVRRVDVEAAGDRDDDDGIALLVVEGRSRIGVER